MNIIKKIVSFHKRRICGSMKTNGANKTGMVTEQRGEGIWIIQGVIYCLSLFLPVALAKRVAA